MQNENRRLEKETLVMSPQLHTRKKQCQAQSLHLAPQVNFKTKRQKDSDLVI